MEHEVAAQLEALDFAVSMNPAYQDPDEGKSREYDVGGYRLSYKNENRRFNVGIKLIVECKSSPNPYAFVARTRADHDVMAAPAEYHFPRRIVRVPTGTKAHREMSPFQAFGLFRHDPTFMDPLKHPVRRAPR